MPGTGQLQYRAVWWQDRSVAVLGSLAAGLQNCARCRAISLQLARRCQGQVSGRFGQSGSRNVSGTVWRQNYAKGTGQLQLQCRAGGRGKVTVFPSPAGTSRTKLSLAGNILIILGKQTLGWWHPGWGQENRKSFFIVWRGKHSSFNKWAEHSTRRKVTHIT